MADVKISALPPGAALTGAELFESVQSAASVQLTAAQLKTYVASSTYTYNVPVTGFSLTIGNGVRNLVLNPAGTLATGTVTLAAAPSDGDIATISSTQEITALTISPNSGQSVSGSAATLAAAVSISYLYRLADTTWYRVR